MHQRYFTTKLDAHKLLQFSGFDPTCGYEKAKTPPSSWYIDPLFFELEKQYVFSKNWIPVGRVDQVEKAGQFFTGNHFGEPYIVVKDQNNNIKCFSNGMNNSSIYN